MLLTSKSELANLEMPEMVEKQVFTIVPSVFNNSLSLVVLHKNNHFTDLTYYCYNMLIVCYYMSRVTRKLNFRVSDRALRPQKLNTGLKFRI